MFYSVDTLRTSRLGLEYFGIQLGIVREVGSEMVSYAVLLLGYNLRAFLYHKVEIGDNLFVVPRRVRLKIVTGIFLSWHKIYNQAYTCYHQAYMQDNLCVSAEIFFKSIFHLQSKYVIVPNVQKNNEFQ